MSKQVMMIENDGLNQEDYSINTILYFDAIVGELLPCEFNDFEQARRYLRLCERYEIISDICSSNKENIFDLYFCSIHYRDRSTKTSYIYYQCFFNYMQTNPACPIQHAVLDIVFDCGSFTSLPGICYLTGEIDSDSTIDKGCPKNFNEFLRQKRDDEGFNLYPLEEDVLPFNCHAVWSISAFSSYEVEISDCGDSARLMQNGTISEWCEIQYDYDRETKEQTAYINTEKDGCVLIGDAIRV